MRKKLCSYVFIILLPLFLLTGCWDSKEVEDMAIITAMAWDKLSINNDDAWQVTARILRPVSKDSQGSGNSTAGENELLIQGTGKTVEEAIWNFAERLPRTAFFGHVSAVIIGERAAQENLHDLVETHLRYPGSRPSSFIIISQGEASRILTAQPEVASIISDEIRRLAAKKAQAAGATYGVSTKECMEWCLSPDRDVVLPEISLYYPNEEEETVPKSVILKDLAVFREGKFVGWLNDKETKGYLFIAQKTDRSNIAVPVEKDNRLFDYSVSSFKSKIVPEQSGDKILYTIKIETKGEVYENGGLPLSAEDIEPLETAVGEKIGEIALSTVKKAQDYDADFLGLTQKLHRFKPAIWKGIAENWRDSFKKAEIKIEVKAAIENTGKTNSKLEAK